MEDQKKAIRGLKMIISEKGPVYVAYHLKYRETTVLYRWIKRQEIPPRALKNVLPFIDKELGKATRRVRVTA